MLLFYDSIYNILLQNQFHLTPRMQVSVNIFYIYIILFIFSTNKSFKIFLAITQVFLYPQSISTKFNWKMQFTLFNS